MYTVFHRQDLTTEANATKHAKDAQCWRAHRSASTRRRLRSWIRWFPILDPAGRRAVPAMAPAMVPGDPAVLSPAVVPVRGLSVGTAPHHPSGLRCVAAGQARGALPSKKESVRHRNVVTVRR